jgi:hypothetical protein
MRRCELGSHQFSFSSALARRVVSVKISRGKEQTLFENAHEAIVNSAHVNRSDLVGEQISHMAWPENRDSKQDYYQYPAQTDAAKFVKFELHSLMPQTVERIQFNR